MRLNIAELNRSVVAMRTCDGDIANSEPPKGVRIKLQSTALQKAPVRPRGKINLLCNFMSEAKNMRTTWICGSVAFAMCYLSSSMAPATCFAATRSAATVHDGINMTEIAYPGYDTGDPPCGFGLGYAQSIGSFSPNRRRFVVVLRRGQVRGDSNLYTMLLWHTKTLGLQAPTAILKMSSSSPKPAIDPGTISWAQDGRSLMFLGKYPGGNEQIFELKLASRKLLQVTKSMTGLVNFSFDADRSVMAYETAEPVKSLWSTTTAQHGLVVTKQGLLEVMYGHNIKWGTKVRLFVRDGRETRQVLPRPGSYFPGFGAGGYDARDISMSPNGRYLIVLETVRNADIPPAWRKYSDRLVRAQLSLIGKGQTVNGLSMFSRYILIDVQSLRSRILLNAPIVGGFYRPVIWSPNSRSAVISDTLLPGGGVKVPGGRLASNGRTAVEVRIRSGAVSVISPLCGQAISWKGQEITCTVKRRKHYTGGLMGLRSHRHVHDKRNGVGSDSCSAPRHLTFRRFNGKWRAAGKITTPLVDIRLREGLNYPPRLFYRMRGQKRSRLLLNLNPQLKRVRIAKERLVTWNWSSGHSITGGLYYPPNYRPGRRYPLVIQTHGFNPERFAYWGEFSTSDAAQPLAARGIFVLQVNDGDSRDWLAPKNGQITEVERAIKIYRSAIAYLSNRGLIDARKVGIIGFSHTCFFVDWALTHDPGLFTAASVTEGGDGSYMEYMLDLENSILDGSLYGGAPFGAQLKSWVKLAPIFRVNRVEAPLLIVVPHHQLALDEWEWLTGLRHLGKPVEMIVLDGRAKDWHILQEPWSISVASGENADWFDFWLNGHEDHRRSKALQYRRWEKLCRMQKQQSPSRPIFCVSG